MTAVDAPSPDLFFQTINAYQQTAALKAAVELDVFSAIGSSPRTAAAIAATCGASERGVCILCDYLTILGFLEKRDGAYTLTPSSSVFLTKDSPAYVGGSIEFLTSPALMDNFDRLTETIRRGSFDRSASTVADENPVWVKFARSMAPLVIPAAETIARLIDAARGTPLRVLDVAAGHGMFGIAVARMNPNATIVALDWAPVLDVALEHAQSAGVADRVQRLEGDALSIDLGSGYDAVLVTNFLHHFNAEECTAFLRKVAAALKAGGKVAILEFVPNEDRVTPPSAASFSMTMLGSTPEGDAYTLPELTQMLEAAGFRGVAAHGLPTPQTVIVATK